MDLLPQNGQVTDILLAFLVNSHHCWNDIIKQQIGGFNCHESDLKIDNATVLGQVFQDNLHVPPPSPVTFTFTLFLISVM